MISNPSVFEYEECVTKEISLVPGIYVFEVWGGEGGRNTGVGGSGGRGGYSRGELTLKQETTFFLHIGEKGSNDKSNSFTGSSCNGGGSGYHNSGGGGGGSDIRVLTDDLFHRIIVSGGGGGTGNTLSEKGGFGGGLTGGNGEDDPSTSGGGGNQEGEITTCSDGTSTGCPNGIFGFGGNATSTSGLSSGGGGGGWYGGSASRNGEGGGGGSGYVLNESSFKPINYFSSSLDYYFHNTSLLGGNSLVPCVSSDCTELGHPGHGAIRITLISYINDVIMSNKFRCIFIHDLFLPIIILSHLFIS